MKIKLSIFQSNSSSSGVFNNFYDPFINKIESRNKKFKGVNYFNLKYNKLNKFDLVAILTDHDKLNYEKILKYSNLIIDCRGRYHNIENKKIINS